MDLRVLILSHEYPPFVFGGLATYVHDLTKLLNEAGIETIVLTASYTNKNDKLEEIYDKNLIILRIPLRNIPFKARWFSLKLRDIVVEIVKKYGIDVVHTNPFYLGSYLKTLKKYARTVITVHGSWYASVNHLKYAFRSFRNMMYAFLDYTFLIPYLSSPYSTWILKKELEYSDAIISPSIHTKYETVVSHNIDPNKIFVVRPPIFLEDVKSIVNENKVFDLIINAKTKPTFLYAGRLSVIKGIHHILESIEMLTHDCNVLIFGDGPMKRLVEAYSRKYENIIYGGKVKPNTWHEILRSLYKVFFIYPSYWEAAPRALLEAYSNGVPALLSSLYWSREYGVLGQAIYVDILSKNDMITKLNRAIEIMENRREYNDMRKRARKYIELFHSKEKVLKNLIDVYTGELKKR